MDVAQKYVPKMGCPVKMESRAKTNLWWFDSLTHTQLGNGSPVFLETSPPAPKSSEAEGRLKLGAPTFCSTLARASSSAFGAMAICSSSACS